MDQYSSKAPPSVPPLGSISTLGTLSYADASSATGTLPVKIEIQGNIDKGFFQSDCEWTCYRRNYFSCICSYNLSPYYPTQPLQYQQLGSKQSYTVFGFAMSISAVVADNDSHTIELVQHTPKRDKGPIMKPEKVRLLPKPLQAAHHPLGLYGHDASLGGPSRLGYGDTFSGGHPADAYQTEHTFERIQFKQATANNGKRRAAQQYYHLLIELWADVGAQATEKFVRIAYRKSAKMIVRGRSPGHYQGERRGSTSSGPGGSGGSMGGFSGGSMMNPDYPPPGPTMGQGYGNTFEPRGGANNFGPARHHHDMPYEAMIPQEDAKSIDTTKGYQYYPGTMYEGQQNDKSGIDLFMGHRNGQDAAVSHMTAGIDPLHDRVKRDPDADMLAGRFMPGPLASSNRCGPYDGKGTSTGYYPTVLPPTSLNIANIT